MTAVLTLCLLASGVAWIINARSLGKKILGGVVLVSVFLAFAPCLLCTLGRLFKQHASFETGDYPLWPALVLLVLVFLGGSCGGDANSVRVRLSNIGDATDNRANERCRLRHHRTVNIRERSGGGCPVPPARFGQASRR